MKLISPNTLQYNINILKKFWTASVQNAPRKLQVFYNYADAYLDHPVDLLFGSGPGTFNSRSAFMVGSPTYFDMIPIIKSEKKPYYFINYAYTLWNEKVIRWYDGFMNQPFTSILALLGEYGLIFTFLLMSLLIRNYRYYTTRIQSQRQLSTSFVHAGLYKFISIFILILIIIDNYIEYPETLALLITIVKLSEQQLKSQLGTSSTM
jgi:hypothetical protein